MGRKKAGYIRRRKTLSKREGPALIKEAEDQIRTVAILFRVTPNERATLQQIAKDEGKTTICLIREILQDAITT